MSILRIVVVLLAIGLLSGCFLFRPYHIQVQQGNIITQKMIKQLKPGMTREQVSFILGTPDIHDPFHHNTWYYVYTNEQDYQPVVRKQLIIHFKDGHLSKIEGNYPPPATLVPEASK